MNAVPTNVWWRDGLLGYTFGENKVLITYLLFLAHWIRTSQSKPCQRFKKYIFVSKRTQIGIPLLFVWFKAPFVNLYKYMMHFLRDAKKQIFLKELTVSSENPDSFQRFSGCLNSNPFPVRISRLPSLQIAHPPLERPLPTLPRCHNWAIASPPPPPH